MLHEASAFWQIAANWTPNATGAANIDWAMAPEINWEHLNKFDVASLEYGVTLGYKFQRRAEFI